MAGTSARLSVLLAVATAAFVVAGVSAAGTSVSTDYVNIVLNQCNGEFVAVEGTIHMETQSRTNKNGTHDQLMINVSGVTGTGLTTNARYVEAHTDTSSSYISLDGFPTEFTHVETRILNRLGEDGTLDDFRYFLRVHGTVNANGVPTVDREESGFECN